MPSIAISPGGADHDTSRPKYRKVGYCRYGFGEHPSAGRETTDGAYESSDSDAPPGDQDGGMKAPRWWEDPAAALIFGIGGVIDRALPRRRRHAPDPREKPAPDGSSREEYARWLDARRNPPAPSPAPAPVASNVSVHSRTGASDGEAVAGFILLVIGAAALVALFGWGEPLTRMAVNLYRAGRVAAAPEPTPYVLWAEWIGGLQRTPDGGFTNPLRWQPVSSHRELAECQLHENVKPNPGWGRFVCLPATVNPNMHGR